MTVTEFVTRCPYAMALRFFPKGYPERNNGHPINECAPKPWRAAMSKHYYTSDTGRLVMGDSDDRDGVEGWGDTPDEAVTALGYEMIDRARKRQLSVGALWKEAEEALAEAIAVFRETP